MIKLKNYPKVEAKFKVFIGNLMNTWLQQAVGESAEEIKDSDLDVIVTTMLESNPRILYDFLDENHVYLQPILLEQLAPEKGWGFELSTVAGCSDEGQSFSTRKDAENNGFELAIKCLEELL